MRRAACRREPALVFQTAEATGFGSLSDPEVLERLAEAGRVLVSPRSPEAEKRS